jgi:tetratricopeptide (TPR) repeat protein
MYKEAVLELEKAKPENSPFQLGALRHAYAEAGRRAGALKVLDEMKERAKKGYFPPFQVALVYARLGEKDQAFKLLEQAYEERFPWLIHLKVDSRLDPLRSDPRFQGLLRRMGLPP